MNPLSFLLICFAGWTNRRQQAVIDHLQEEVRVLQEQLGKCPRFTEDQRRRMAVKGKPVGRKGLRRFASLVTPDNLLARHRRLIAKKNDGTKNRGPDRPPTAGDLKVLILKMARENRSWGYTCIQGALANLKHEVELNIFGDVRLTPVATSRWMPLRDFVHASNRLISSDGFQLFIFCTSDGICPTSPARMPAHENQKHHPLRRSELGPAHCLRLTLAHRSRAAARATRPRPQRRDDRAGFGGVKPRHKFAERCAANRFARDADKAIDDKAVPAYRVPELDGGNIALRRVRQPVTEGMIWIVEALRQIVVGLR